jgi:hypothetical protein
MDIKQATGPPPNAADSFFLWLKFWSMAVLVPAAWKPPGAPDWALLGSGRESQRRASGDVSCTACPSVLTVLGAVPGLGQPNRTALLLGKATPDAGAHSTTRRFHFVSGRWQVAGDPNGRGGGRGGGEKTDD